MATAVQCDETETAVESSRVGYTLYDFSPFFDPASFSVQCTGG